MVAAAVLVGVVVGKVASPLSELLCDEARFKNPVLAFNNYCVLTCLLELVHTRVLNRTHGAFELSRLTWLKWQNARMSYNNGRLCLAFVVCISVLESCSYRRTLFIRRAVVQSSRYKQF